MMNAKQANELALANKKVLNERAKKVAINFAEVGCEDAIRLAIYKGNTSTVLEVPEDINIELVIEHLKENGYHAWNYGKKTPTIAIMWSMQE